MNPIAHVSFEDKLYSVGDSMTLTCDSGYYMVSGDSTWTCQPDHTWSGQEPVCGKTLRAAHFNTSGVDLHYEKHDLYIYT